MSAVLLSEPEYRDLVAAWHTELRDYHDILATTGIEHGLIGPREGPRLWDRHLINCAAVAVPKVGLVPTGALVADIGSGAGLPGIVWALTRPDIRVTLIEPLLRRTEFLQATIEELSISDRVTVVRGRALEVPPVGADVVTSRAVTALPALVQWSARHCGRTGSIVAVKGGRASQELSEARESIRTVSGQGRRFTARVVTIAVSAQSPEARELPPLATVVLLD